MRILLKIKGKGALKQTTVLQLLHYYNRYRETPPQSATPAEIQPLDGSGCSGCSGSREGQLEPEASNQVGINPEAQFLGLLLSRLHGNETAVAPLRFCSDSPRIQMETSRPRFFTPAEVSAHDTVDDLWVSCLGKVCDLSPLVDRYRGEPPRVGRQERPRGGFGSRQQVSLLGVKSSSSRRGRAAVAHPGVRRDGHQPLVRPSDRRCE